MAEALVRGISVDDDDHLALPPDHLEQTAEAICKLEDPQSAIDALEDCMRVAYALECDHEAHEIAETIRTWVVDTAHRYNAEAGRWDAGNETTRRGAQKFDEFTAKEPERPEPGEKPRAPIRIPSKFRA